jgi:hypothetical protein
MTDRHPAWAAFPVDFAADETVFEIEMAVDVGMDRGELL